MDTIEIPLADVVVGDRIRQDVGDTTDLMLSMEQLGQLHPIGIDRDNRLIFGGRRLDAAERLSWEAIRAVRLPNLDTAAKLLRAEQDENTCRQPLTPLEMRELARRLDAMTPRSKPGPKDNADELLPKFGTNSETTETPAKTPRRKVIAKAVGVSDETLRKIDVVATAGEEPDASPAVKAAAAEMEQTGKVEPAYRAVKAATAPKVDPIKAKRAAILDTLAPLEREIRHLADMDQTMERSKAIEGLYILVAAVKGKRPAQQSCESKTVK